MLQNLALVAELIITFNNIPFLVVAEENYIVVNFKEFSHLDQLMKEVSTMSGPGSEAEIKVEKKASGGPLKKLNDLNAKVREMGAMLEIRVGNKTYVVLGGNSASIKAAAIFGKIGSFFGR